MKKLLFTHSYFLRFDPKQWKLQQPYPPLAPLYAAALIRAKGFDVRFYDTMFSPDTKEIVQVLNEYSPEALIIYDDGFNYLTKMCLTNMREAAFEMISFAKTKGITVIVSGSDATDQSKLYLDAGADFIIAGEGEQTLLELLQTLEASGNTKSEIAGLV